MKILIIGQAPPAVKQTLPYDTTLLYEMFSWVGIDKEKAQELFEFEAMTDKFPGHSANGHKAPPKAEMENYYHEVLKHKILLCDKVLVLGNVAKDALIANGILAIKDESKISFMIHPSKRNYSKIIALRSSIIAALNNLITKH